MDGVGKFDALVKAFVLAQFKNDVALKRVGVESGIFLRMVGFKFHHGILTFSHFEVFGGFVQAECVDLTPFDIGAVAVALVNGVDVDGHEEV